MAGNSNNQGPARGDSYAAMASSVAAAAGSLTSAFSAAGQSVTGTASQIASGTTSVVSDMGGALTGAVSAVGGAVSSLSSSLGPIGPVVGGVVSAVSTVAGTVVNVASAAAEAAVAVGTTILSTVTTLATAAVSVVAGVISTVSSVISAFTGLMSGVNAGLGVLAAAASAVTSVISGIANVISTIASALGSVVTGLVSAVTSVVSALTSAFKSVSESLSALAGIAGQMLGGFVSALQSSLDALTSFANDVSSININTGMSIGDASNLTNDMRAVGISSGQTAKMFGSTDMMPEQFNARSHAVGMTDLSSKNFLPSLAKDYQNSVKQDGLPFANAKLEAQWGGPVSPTLKQHLNMDPAKLQSNIDYGRQVQTQLGVGPSQIKSASEDLPLLMDRVSTFIDTVKMKFAAELLPALEGAFNVISGIFKDNAGTIANVIQTATHAIFVDGPDLAANAANTVLDWGSNIADMFFMVTDAAISFVEGFGSQNGVLFTIINQVAKFIDFLILIVNRIKGVLKNGGAPIKFSAQDAVKKAAGKVKTWDFKGARQRSNDFKNKKNEWVKNRHENIADIHARTGTTADRERAYRDRQLAVQEEQLAVQKEHLGVAKNQGSSGLSRGQVLGRIGAYIAEDAYRLTSR